MSSNTQLSNASILIYGASLFFIVANAIMWRFVPYEKMPVIPGFNYLPGIAWALFFFCPGVLLRSLWPKVKWWIQLPVLLIGVFFLCRYISFQGWSTSAVPNMYAALFCFGFVAPLESIRTAKNDKGWFTIILLAALVFCDVAISVVNWRLQWWGEAIRPEFADMWRLMLWLTSATEPVLKIVVVYLVALFSFSKIGQWLGRQRWLKWFVIAAAIWVYLPNLVNMIGRYDIWYFSSRFIVQPVNILLFVALYRRLAVKNDNGGKLSWKECFKL